MIDQADAGDTQSASNESAIEAMVTAKGWVATAKLTKSRCLVECAQRDLQAAVDDARDQGMQWGEIGVTLGIARGNAYQRYRKRLSPSRFEVEAAKRKIA